jgi:uncharacterized protein
MRVTVRVTPQASRLEISSFENGILRIKLTKGAHDGEANEQLIELLSDKCRIPKRDIQIVQGAARREKVVELPNESISRLHEVTGTK